MERPYEANFVLPTGTRQSIICTDKEVADLVVETAKARGCLFAHSLPVVPLEAKYAVSLLSKYLD